MAETIQRLDELTAPVEVGKFYLVPTVAGEWFRKYNAWPVIGPQHSDKQCLNFDNQHYHIDARFMPKRSHQDIDYWSAIMASPLQVNRVGNLNYYGLGQPVWRKRKCQRLSNPANAEIMEKIERAPRRNGWMCHFEMWKGKQAKHDNRGWVCPHRNVSLADHVVVDGVITCPLHMLRIDAETGIVLPPIIDAHYNGFPVIPGRAA